MLRFLSLCCAQETLTDESEVEMLKPLVAWLCNSKKDEELRAS